ncbi:MAG: DUF3943 domain-containing protein, partial [Myxococcaceae bacterium]|nr:DUF3943 domain-containing protein [Myxococcaceae bacterium]
MLGLCALMPTLLLLASTPGAAEPAPEGAPTSAAATSEESDNDLIPGTGLTPPSTPRPRVNFTLHNERSWLIPLVEVPALNLAILSFNIIVLKADWARVSPDSIGANLRSPWVIDSDDAWVNFVGHPYHGTLAYNAARSNGLTFWESAAFPLVSSTLWELAGETEQPSLNDTLLTAASGIFLGETFLRTSWLLLDGPNPPGPLQQLVAFVLNPVGGINRQVFGRRIRRDALPELPPFEVRFLLGGTAFGPAWQATPAGATTLAPRLQPYAAMELTSSFPGEPGASLRTPFEHYELEMAAGLPAPLTGNLYLRGLIVGRPVGGDETLVRGAWGLFGSHDFGTGPDFRVATTALGLGVALQARDESGTRLRATGIVSGVLLGGAGTFAEADVVDTGAYDVPLYSVGPGGQVLLDVELSHPGLGAFGFTGRAYRLTGLTPGRGWEKVDLLGTRALLRIAPGHGVGAEVLFGRRHADALGGTRQVGTLGRLFWVLELEHSSRERDSG